jgi:hypothetical protein
MLGHSITYKNFNGVDVTKTFYFNITTSEIALAELESDGTWSQSLKIIGESNQGSVVVPEFKKILKWTYGEKSSDGESFDKSDEAWARFVNSEAWSTLIWDLLTKDNFAAEFMNAVMPADLAAKAKEAQAQPGFRPGANTERPTPPAASEVPGPGVIPLAPPLSGVGTGTIDKNYADPIREPAPLVDGITLYPEPPEEAGIIHQSLPREDPQLS